MRRGGRACGACRWIVLATLGLSSCAPHPIGPPSLDVGTRQARYAAAATAREGRAVAAEAEISLWVRSQRLRDVPGAQARLLLAAPDAFRLRVESLFGTALDVGVRGDSLTAYVPSRRIGLALAQAGESLGIHAPGPWGVRMWSAAWRPPPGAWSQATWDDSLLKVRWTEGDDLLELGVLASGLPMALELTTVGGRTLELRYDGWEYQEGVMWPVRLTLTDAAADLKIVSRVHRVRFARRPDAERLRVRIPRDAERMTLARLKDAFQFKGEL